VESGQLRPRGQIQLGAAIKDGTSVLRAGLAQTAPAPAAPLVPQPGIRLKDWKLFRFYKTRLLQGHETDLSRCPQFGRYQGDSGQGGYVRRLPKMTPERKSSLYGVTGR
jgi:hypothetical protein